MHGAMIGDADHGIALRPPDAATSPVKARASGPLSLWFRSSEVQEVSS